MVKVWFYGYASGVVSSRKIAQKLETDVAFIYLSGMQRPDFRTLSDFRKDHIEELRELFVQIVRLCRQLGMVSLGQISLDSTVITANASRSRTYDEERMSREEREITEGIEAYLQQAEAADREEDEDYGAGQRGNELPKELQSRKARLEKIAASKAELRRRKPSERRGERTVNLTDMEATFQRQGGRVVPGYRGEVVVDSEEQVIVAAEVTSEQNDRNQLIPLVDEALANTGGKETLEPILLSADSAYSSGPNLEKLEARGGIDPYIPDDVSQAQERGTGTREVSPFHKDRFRYHPEGDYYVCPLGQRLRPLTRTWGNRGYRIALYRCEDGESCSQRKACTKRSSGRIITISEHEARLQAMRQKLRTEEGRRRYNQRKVIVEPVFGNLKQNLGFRAFLLRGLRKVRGEFSLWAMAHNLLKIARFLRRMGRTPWETLSGNLWLGAIPDPGG
jgi:transposase